MTREEVGAEVKQQVAALRRAAGPGKLKTQSSGLGHRDFSFGEVRIEVREIMSSLGNTSIATGEVGIFVRGEKPGRKWSKQVTRLYRSQDLKANARKAISTAIKLGAGMTAMRRAKKKREKGFFAKLMRVEAEFGDVLPERFTFVESKSGGLVLCRLHVTPEEAIVVIKALQDLED